MQPRNLTELMRLSGIWIEELRELILDMDSSVSETYGEQDGTAYNGRFGCTCYHPPFCGQWMNEQQMKTSVTTEEVSLPSAQEAGVGLKFGAEHVGGSEKHGFGVA